MPCPAGLHLHSSLKSGLAQQPSQHSKAAGFLSLTPLTGLGLALPCSGLQLSSSVLWALARSMLFSTVGGSRAPGKTTFSPLRTFCPPRVGHTLRMVFFKIITSVRNCVWTCLLCVGATPAAALGSHSTFWSPGGPSYPSQGEQSLSATPRYQAGWESPYCATPSPPTMCGRLRWQTMSSFRRAGVHCDRVRRGSQAARGPSRKKEMCFQGEGAWHAGMSPALTPPHTPAHRKSSAPGWQ